MQRHLFLIPARLAITCLAILLSFSSTLPAVAQSQQPRPQWVWLEEAPDQTPAEAVLLRREVNVKGMVAARLFVASDGPVTVWLDGHRVMRLEKPGQPQSQDATSFLDRLKGTGKMTLAVRADRPASGEAGVLLRLDLDSGWRTASTVVTDKQWQARAIGAGRPGPGKGWQTAKGGAGWSKPQRIAAIGEAPWTDVTAAALAALAPLKTPTATPPEQMKVADGFRVELVHSVPKDQQGSWVSLCTAPGGKLIACDQYGGLFTITPGKSSHTETLVEKIDVDLGEAQGLLWAFDSLYVVVNRGRKYESGLYRVTDSDDDGRLDRVEQLRKLEGNSEHGPHAVLLTPDKQNLYVVCGNRTKLTELSDSRVPQVWDEDNLLPRPYGRGFMKGTPAPGGYICKVSPDGNQWELIASGFRNEYDAALNADGELFTFDADMEWDVNTPWYRPTRVCQVVSGADFGWRNGGGKWPVYYPDTVPPTVDIGPGSPTGITFGYGAKFPGKYQRSLFISDWSYGKLYAVHLVPQGAGYAANVEEFITGTPLPLTDIVVHPDDGAMYFAIGGRRVQSGLYRVTYEGDLPTEAVDAKQAAGRELRTLRRELEANHRPGSKDVIEQIWPHLDHADRLVRYAARIALEHQPHGRWRAQALDVGAQSVDTSLAALLAYARQAERPGKVAGKNAELDPPAPAYPADVARNQFHLDLVKALAAFDWEALNERQRLELLRVYAITFARTGPPTEAVRSALIAKLGLALADAAPPLSMELAQMLVYLQPPAAAEQIIALLESAPTQEEQIHYAKSLRHLRVGWTRELRKTYLQWFVRATGYRGGASFGLFVANIKQDALAAMPNAEREALAEVINAQPVSDGPQIAPPRPFVKKYTVAELAPLLATQLNNRDFDRGRRLFGAANCFACHRFAGEGGAIGPDLTGLAGRFSQRDILESTVEPSKVISDQFAAVRILTTDGEVVVGRVVNLANDSMKINTNMMDPNAQTSVDRKQIERMQPSKVSMMPAGLLDTFSEDEILDLMAYLLSRGDRKAPMFQQP